MNEIRVKLVSSGGGRRVDGYLRIGSVLTGVRICDSFSRKSSLNERALRVSPLLPFKLCCFPIGLLQLFGDTECPSATNQNERLSTR